MRKNWTVLFTAVVRSGGRSVELNGAGKARFLCGGNAGVSFWQSGGQCLRRLACHHAALHTPTRIADLLRRDLYPASPFQPRVTVTFGRGGNKRTVVNKRRATGVRDMYSDQLNGGTGSNRKRSVKDRLGNPLDQQSSITRSQVNGKRQRREEGGKWKHDLFEEKEVVEIVQPNGEDLSKDLRSKLRRGNTGRGQKQQLQLEAATTGAVKDLREKLSGLVPGPVPTPQLSREPTAASQRRLASVVRGSSGVASLANLRSGASRSTGSLQTATVVQKPSVLLRSQPAEAGQSTVAGLLQALGLSKYLPTFQEEEVDMTALQQMRDDDLKELGIPMGPRKKILLAVSGSS
ncbi:hypothetical protein R1flu_007640 [Riccia fluitans]|uniref:SAM domain-containing protein n=1 Tax=Riccia fluitans TaxID=41844 RepID=A0ABD1YZI2_9MARC